MALVIRGRTNPEPTSTQKILVGLQQTLAKHIKLVRKEKLLPDSKVNEAINSGRLLHQYFAEDKDRSYALLLKHYFEDELVKLGIKNTYHWMKDVPRETFLQKTTPPLPKSSSSDGISIDDGDVILDDTEATSAVLNSEAQHQDHPSGPSEPVNDPEAVPITVDTLTSSSGSDSSSTSSSSSSDE